MISRAVSLSLLAVATPSLAATQGDDQAQAIIVTGRGLDPGLGEDVYDVTRIDRARLDHSPSNRLEDVLRDVPGFQQFRRSDSRSANPTSQGATLRALGGNASSRALLILDGVPLSDPFGGWISWPALDPRRLGQVRVVRGGGTGANGPGALAGTIELASAAPDELGGLSAGLAYGSRDSFDAFAGCRRAARRRLRQRSPPPGRRATASSRSIEDQRGPADRPSPYRQGSVAVRAVTPVSAGLELQANLAAFTDARERGTAFSEIDTDGADGSLRLVGRGALPFSALVYVQVRDFSNQFAAVNADRTVATQTLDQYSVPSTGLGARVELRPLTGPLELRVGADWRETEGRTQELFQFVAGAPTRGRVAGGRTRTIGGFAEAGWEHGDLTLSGGGRIDRWWIEQGSLRERFLATGAPITDTHFPDRGGWEATGRAGLAWRAGRRLHPARRRLSRLAAADAERALPPVPGRRRRDRRQCRARARTGGRRGSRPRSVARRTARGSASPCSPTGSRTRSRNVTLGSGPGVFPGVGFVAAGGQFRQRQNVDAIVSRGVEVDAEPGLRALADRRRLQLRRRRGPRRRRGAAARRAAAGAGAAPQRLGHPRLGGGDGALASLTARYVGDQYEDDLNRQLIPDAFTLDAVGVAAADRAVWRSRRAPRISPTPASSPAFRAPASSSARRRARCGSACAGGSINGVGQQIAFIQTGPTTAGLSLCTGSLINPRTVITAAHCVYNNPMHRYGSNTGTGPGVSGNFGTGGAPVTSKGIPLSFGFESLNRNCFNAAGLPFTCPAGQKGPYETWRDASFQTIESRHIYNANQVWYGTGAQPVALGGGGEFANQDIALVTLDTHANGIPTWTLLFSPLDGPTHATITGYGGAGVGLSGIGNLAGIDYRRRSAENMIDDLMSSAGLEHDAGDRRWAAQTARSDPARDLLDGFRRSRPRPRTICRRTSSSTSAPAGAPRNNGYYDFNGLGGAALANRGHDRGRQFGRTAGRRPALGPQGHRRRADRQLLVQRRHQHLRPVQRLSAVVRVLGGHRPEQPVRLCLGEDGQRRLVRSRRTGSRTWIPIM